MKADPKSEFVIEFDCQEVATFDHEITAADRIVLRDQIPGRVVMEVTQRNHNDFGEIFFTWVHSFIDFDLMKRFQESVPFIRGNPSRPSNRRREQTKRNQSFGRKQRLLKQIALCKRKG